jgi:CBS domain-containing protein
MLPVSWGSEEGITMKTVRDILNVKGLDVWRIGPDATVFDALQLMAEKEIGALVVMEEDRVVGIVTERDYARKVILQGRSSPTTLVKEIMITPVVHTYPGQPIEECMAVMTEKRTRHLPVIEEGRLIGIISIGDLVKSIIADQKFIIEQLERYITS